MATNQKPRSDRVKHIVERTIVLEDGTTVTGLSHEEVSAASLKRDRPEHTIYAKGIHSKLDISLTEWRIIEYILDRYELYSQNVPHVNQRELADFLGVDRTYVSKVMARLAARNIISKQDHQRYLVNPYIGWRGSMPLWDTARWESGPPIYKADTKTHLWIVDDPEDLPQ